ncbi:MAG: Tad domain-containing protein, partial [Pseudomonadota bacterium]
MKLKKFEEDERGSVLAFVVVMFVFMILAAGMAVDFIRHETARADLQNALDRGVLAAAAFNQQYIDQIGDVSGDGDLTDE